MKRHPTPLLLVVCATLLASAVFAQQLSVTPVPNFIRYEGTLKDAENAPLTLATTSVTFSIYTQQNGGAPLWLETQNVSTDSTGNYSVLLGSTTAAGLPGDLFSAQEQRWLSVQVQGQTEQPRVLMVSVPYAFKAHDAETLGGRSVSDFVLAQDANASGGASNSNPAGSASITNLLATGSGGGPLTNILGATNFVDSTTNQIVSITQNGTGEALTAVGSTSNPIVAVTQNGAGPGLNIIQNNAHGTGAGLNIIQNNAQATGFGLSITQKGTTPGLYSTASQYAIEGYAAGNSGTIGVHGVASGTAAVGVLGEVESGSSMGSVGITGQAHSTGGIGMKGIAYDPSGSSVGISAQVQSPNGTAMMVNNTAGGMLMEGLHGSNVMFSVDGSGNVNAHGTFTGNGSGLSGISFFNLSGTLMSSQLGGTYGNPVTLSNSTNTFSGNGFGLIGIPFLNLSGTLLSSQFSGTYTNSVNLNGSFSGGFSGNGSGLTGVQPAGGSSFYIQNGTTQQMSTNFNIDGGGTLGGNLSANSVNATSTSTGYQLGSSTVLQIGSAADGNVFAGIGAGANNTTGSGIFNVFAGYDAGYNNAGGYSNSFIGNSAGFENTTGVVNNFIGVSAGFSNTTGYYNTFDGGGAGEDNTTGSENTYVGALAGDNATSGSNNNTYLGFSAGGNNTSGNNNIYIASPGCGQYPCGESSTIRIGGDVNSQYGAQTAAYIAGIYNSTLSFSSGDQVVCVNPSGGLYGAMFGSACTTMTSSRRFKEQIADMGDSTDALMNLRPVTFLYKPEYSKGERTLQYGLIAEEVAQVYPELVAYDKDGQPYTVRYQYLAPMLLNEVQKQYRRAEQQSEIIASQQTEIMAQKQEIENLKGQLQVQNAAMQERLTRLEGLIREQTQTLATAQKP